MMKLQRGYKMKKIISVCILFFTLVSICSASPKLFYSDLTSGPKTGGQDNKGVFVSIYGSGFGSTQNTSSVSIGGGNADNYPVWSDSKVTFQLGANAATGNIVITVGGETSNALPFTVRAGNIYFCTPTGSGDGSFANPFAPDDFVTAIDSGVGNEDGATCYFRSGTYDGEYATVSWRSNFALKAAHSGISGGENAFVGYPGETAILSRNEIEPNTGNNFRRYDGGSDHGSSYIVMSNFTMIADGACVYPGSNSRVIGNIMTGCTDMSPAGVIGVNGTADGSWVVTNVQIYGNTIGGGNPTTTQDHAIYPGYGVDNIDIGWNVIASSDDLGSKISFNTNDAWGNQMVWDNILIHDNYINTTGSSDGRAINTYEMGDGSNIKIWNNIIIADTSGTISPLMFCSGDIYMSNNTIYANSPVNTGVISLYEITPYGHTYAPSSLTLYNNIVYANGSTEYYLEITGSSMPVPTINNNLFYGLGVYDLNVACSNGCVDLNSIEADPSFTTTPPLNPNDCVLQVGSSAISTGSALSTVSNVFTTDYFGNVISDPVDIGAIAYVSVTAPTTTISEIDTTTLLTYQLTGIAQASTGRGVASVTIPGQTVIPDTAWGSQTVSWSCTVSLPTNGDYQFTATVTDNIGETGTASTTITKTSLPAQTPSTVTMQNVVLKGLYK